MEQRGNTCVYMCADDLGELLLGECKLQTYLKENPLKQGASPRGPRPKLVEVRKHLTAALDRGNLKVTERLQMESTVLFELLFWMYSLFKKKKIAFSHAGRLPPGGQLVDGQTMLCRGRI